MPLNVEKLDKLIAYLANRWSEDFTMDGWAMGHNANRFMLGDLDMPVCKTPACLAGHAAFLFQPDTWLNYLKEVYGDRPTRDWLEEDEPLHPKCVAKKELGLTEEQADALFFSSSDAWRHYAIEHPFETELSIALHMLRDIRKLYK